MLGLERYIRGYSKAPFSLGLCTHGAHAQIRQLVAFGMTERKAHIPPAEPTAYVISAVAPVSVAPGTVPATQRSELGLAWEGASG